MKAIGMLFTVFVLGAAMQFPFASCRAQSTHAAPQAFESLIARSI